MQHIAKFMRRTRDIKPYGDPKSGFIRVVSTGGAEARLSIETDHTIHKVCGPFRHPRIKALIYVYFVEDKLRSIPNSERRKGEYEKSGTVYCDDDLRSMRKKIKKRFPKNVERRKIDESHPFANCTEPRIKKND